MSSNDCVNILVVDDLPHKLLSLQAVLESPGLRIVTANSGVEALKRLTEQDFALILLDVSMPEMDGFETAALVRQRKRFAHVPIIFVTAYADEMRLAKGYSLGAVDYILTPVVPEVLRAKVQVFVDLHRKTREIERMAEERVQLARAEAARAAAEDASQHSRFLAEAITALTTSLDVRASVPRLLQLVVPYLADVGLLVCLDPQKHVSLAELAWTPAPDSAAQTLSLTPQLEALPLANDLRRVLASGRINVLTGLNEEWSATLVAQPAEAEANGGDRPHLRITSAGLYPLAAHGKMLGVLMLAMGVSGREPREPELELARELANRAALALDNAQLYRDIQESDRRKNEFLSTLAHELRNPLAPVNNAVHVLKLRQTMDPQLAWAVDMIDRQLEHIVRIVDDLLDIARITRGKVRLQLEPVNVASAISWAVETSQPLIQARKHHLSVSTPREPVWVLGDPARLTQILTNLLNNAAKYTEEGGRIWVSAEAEGESAVLRVRDSGIGIPADMLAAVFDLFTQGERALDRSQGGLGIGLTLVRQLVEMHGGRVEASSPGLNQGSEFSVHLPLLRHAEKRDGQEVAADGDQGATGAQRVLVVDDNRDAAESLAELLRLNGHDVATSHDGSGAIERVESFRPNVVFLDIGLPGMSGFEVARRLRNGQGYSGVLVALTGYGSDEDRRRSHEAGFDAHLVKPVDPAALARIVSQALSQRQSAQTG